MLYLKITLGKEIHLLTKEANFVELMRFIKDSFKNLPKNFEITYKDSDGDNISISNDEDVKTLYATSTEKFVKISIVPIDEEHQDIAVENVSEKKEEVKVEEVKPVEPEPVPQVEKKVEVVVEAPVAEPVPVEVPVQVEKVEPVEVVPQVPVEIVVEEKKVEEPENKEKKGCPFKFNGNRNPMCPFPQFMPPPPSGPIHMPPPFWRGPGSSEQREGGCPFPGKEFFKMKMEQMITKKIEDMLPCIINKVKLELEGKSKVQAPVDPEAVVHRFVKCDGCNAQPIVGIRYKCFECADFDFCEKCEGTVEHPHNFIKIKKPLEGCGRFFWKRQQEGNKEGRGHHWKKEWHVLGHAAKRAFKLSKHFECDPENFRELVENNPELNFHQLKELYMKNNNIQEKKEELNEERIMRRCKKLAFVFRQPANQFVELVTSNPEKKVWELVEMKRNAPLVEKKVEEPVINEVPAKIEEQPKVEEPVVVVEEKKVEEPKVEEKKVEEPIKRVQDDLNASNILIVVDKKPVEPAPAPVVEPPKPVVELPKRNILDAAEVDFKLKNDLLNELLMIAGDENDYIAFIRKNYKQGIGACLNLWFEQNN